MRDGLYETMGGHFFVCRGEEKTKLCDTKEKALKLETCGSAINLPYQFKWIAPIYPSNGIWKNPMGRYLAHKNGKITNGNKDIDWVIHLANKEKFTLSASNYPNTSIEYISELPTSRVKSLSGKFILTLDPPEGDFDIYVRRFGFYEEVTVEDVMRFAREKHPCWESWLLEKGIPFEEEEKIVIRDRIVKVFDDVCWEWWLEKNGIPFEEEIMVGDIVKVTQDGKLYTTYRELADILGAKRYKCVDGTREIQGKLGRVVNIGKHPDFSDAKPVALVDILSEEILIGVDGLSKIS